MAHANTSTAAHAAHHDDEQHIAHITPLKYYIGVWAALTFLTVVTVAVSYVDFNAMLGVPNVNLLVAMMVASVKATLVAVFFMHLKWDNKLNGVIFGSSLIFLSIFFFLTFADLGTRGKVDPYQGTSEKPHGVKTVPVAAPAGEAKH